MEHEGSLEGGMEVQPGASRACHARQGGWPERAHRAAVRRAQPLLAAFDMSDLQIQIQTQTQTQTLTPTPGTFGSIGAIAYTYLRGFYYLSQVGGWAHGSASTVCALLVSGAIMPRPLQGFAMRTHRRRASTWCWLALGSRRRGAPA